MTDGQHARNAGPRPRVGFVTIGQSPRDDIVPELVSWVGRPIEALQAGALDDLSPDAIAAMAPVGAEPRLVSRLADGSEVVMSRGQAYDRVRAVLAEIDRQGLDAVVLLCTGRFPRACLRTPFVSSQAAVDYGVAALVHDAGTLGVMVPSEAQARNVERRGWPTCAFDEDMPGPSPAVIASHATPYGPDGPRREDFERAARDLASSDLLVLHCMGYDERMLGWVRAVSGSRVLLARRLVASALRQLL